ncbi:hypothetical protein Tco_1210033 [Tanacetum coccineum]
MKVEESLNVTFDESPPPTKLSPLVDDDVGEEESIKKNTKLVNNNNEEDESIEVDEIVNIKESKNHPLDQEAKKVVEAVEKRFGRKATTRKTPKCNLLKQQYENFNAHEQETIDQTFDRLQNLVSQLELLDESFHKKMLINVNQKLLRSLSPEWNTHAVVWRNKR